MPIATISEMPVPVSLHKRERLLRCFSHTRQIPWEVTWSKTTRSTRASGSHVSDDNDIQSSLGSLAKGEGGTWMDAPWPFRGTEAPASRRWARPEQHRHVIPRVAQGGARSDGVCVELGFGAAGRIV